MLLHYFYISGGRSQPVTNARQEAFNIRRAGMHTGSDRRGLESMLRPEGSSPNDRQGRNGRHQGQQQQQRGQKRPHENDEEEDDDQAHDEVRLWEDGFKDRYYESKFDVPADNLEFR